MKNGIKLLVSALALSTLITGVSAKSLTLEPLVIDKQGSFAIGGNIIKKEGVFNPNDFTNPAGQTLHGDHAYVFYQVPQNAKKYPIVMWHGYGQFSKTWESTPDGREGFQNIFLRDKYGVYLIDQPRRGNAGRTTKPLMIDSTPNDQRWFNTFRVGIWPKFFEGVQFSQDKESLNQYFRQMTPDTGPIDIDLNSGVVAKLFDKIGNGILMTHSHSGGMGWQTVLKSKKIKAVISYEPGSNFVFPKGEAPGIKVSSGGSLAPVEIELAEFKKLTKIPIIIFYGDFIPNKPSKKPGQDMWRIRLEMAKLWVDKVNKYGGNATLVHLPEVGVFGNTHFPFSDLNNLKIAELTSQFLEKNNLN
jgi:hypothetical protein